MAAENEVIEALAELFTYEQLSTKLEAAANDVVSGVVVTNVIAEGAGGSATPLQMPPGDAVRVLKRARAMRQALDTGDDNYRRHAQAAPMGTRMNFSTRRVTT